MKKALLFLLFIILGGLVSGCNGCFMQDISSSAQNDDILDRSESSPVMEASSWNDSAYLSLITIDNGYHVTNYAEYNGQIFQYIIFELENPKNKTEYTRDVYWEIVVCQNGISLATLRHTLNEFAWGCPEISDLVLEKDVDFDGQNDILFCCGHFGNQGLIRYSCYLNHVGCLTASPSFSEIANPALDADNQVVLSSWRNSAASHSYAVYTWIDGDCVETERLTEELIQVDNGDSLWTWTDEIFSNGEWKLYEYFTEDDYDRETIQRKLYGKDSKWGIDQDRWRTLYNNGLMSDFSIYSSES